MLFVCICDPLGHTAKIKIHGFLVLTLGKVSHINASGSEAQEHTGIAQLLIPATGKHLQPLPSQVAIQKGNSQTYSYHVHDEKRNSVTVKIEIY